MNTTGSIESFLAADHFAVAGASRNPSKYGHKVLRALLDRGFHADPINPSASEVLGRQAYASLKDLPQVPESLSIVTPPSITREVVDQAIALGVQHVWMQPGAEDESASQAARDAGLTVIDDGSCLLVALATLDQESRHQHD